MEKGRNRTKKEKREKERTENLFLLPVVHLSIYVLTIMRSRTIRINKCGRVHRACAHEKTWYTADNQFNKFNQ